jgi:hypothetical protein
MDKNEKKKIEEELDKLYSEASEETELDYSLIASKEDLGDVTEVTIYDYDKDLTESEREGVSAINNMADLYIGQSEQLVNHPYIKDKIKHDSVNHGDMAFLQKLTKRALILQMKQMDLGDNSSRSYEVLYSGIKELRENIKQGISTQNTIEGFYKAIKDDLGISSTPSLGENNSNGGGAIMDDKTLNTKLEEMMKKGLAGGKKE